VIKQTMQEWRDEMAKQKKEILDELSRLRIETSNTPKTSSDL